MLQPGVRQLLSPPGLRFNLIGKCSSLRRAAIKKGKKLDPRSLIAAEFMIVGTLLPKRGYSAAAVLAFYRLLCPSAQASHNLPTPVEPVITKCWL